MVVGGDAPVPAWRFVLVNKQFIFRKGVLRGVQQISLFQIKTISSQIIIKNHAEFGDAATT